MNFPREKSAVHPPFGTWAYYQIMLDLHSASLNRKTEYYIFLPKIRASLAHNRSQVKPIRQIHQVQIQATGTRHEASVDRLVPARQTAMARSRRFSYGFHQNGCREWLCGGFAVRFQEDAYIGVNVGVYEEGLKVG
jgi:hypothetical protein